MNARLAKRAAACVADNLNTLLKEHKNQEAKETALFFACWFAERGLPGTASRLIKHAQHITP